MISSRMMRCRLKRQEKHFWTLLTSIAPKRSKRKALHHPEFATHVRIVSRSWRLIPSMPHYHDKIPFFLKNPSPSCQNTHNSRLFSENNLKYSSIFDPHLTGCQCPLGGRSRPWMAKAGSGSKLMQLWRVGIGVHIVDILPNNPQILDFQNKVQSGHFAGFSGEGNG